MRAKGPALTAMGENASTPYAWLAWLRTRRGVDMPASTSGGSADVAMTQVIKQGKEGANGSSGSGQQVRNCTRVNEQ